MPEYYQRVTRILVWVVAISMIAYFVISPFTSYRAEPPRTSPGSEEAIPSSDLISTTTQEIPEQSQTALPTSIPDNLLPNQEGGTTTQ